MKARESYRNDFGALGAYLPGGAISTTSHAFFQSLGTNGRSCVTCHQPPSGMSISLSNIGARFNATKGRDPLFAAVDGANCPNALEKIRAADPLTPGAPRHVREASSLLLNRGVIRITLPWPPRDAAGLPITPDFDLTITPEADAPGCNTDALHGLAATGKVSVYRRPPAAAQMNLKTFRFDNASPILPGSLMWDGRSPSLEEQALEATRVHAQSTKDPTAAQIAQIVSFQTGVFVAQASDAVVGRLDIDGARGGPVNLRNQIPQAGNGFPFTEYSRWSRRGDKSSSIARGQAIFNGLTFNVTNVDGFNTVSNTPLIATCSSCHNIAGSGADMLPATRLSIGVGGGSVVFGGLAAADDLPQFTLTCHGDAVTGLGGQRQIVTNDPGLALLTGRCFDIERFAVPQLRALAAREPYFHDGSSRTLQEVVTFYMARFAIPLSKQQQDDLVNFLLAL